MMRRHPHRRGAQAGAALRGLSVHAIIRLMSLRNSVLVGTVLVLLSSTAAHAGDITRMITLLPDEVAECVYVTGLGMAAMQNLSSLGRLLHHLQMKQEEARKTESARNIDEVRAYVGQNSSSFYEPQMPLLNLAEGITALEAKHTPPPRCVATLKTTQRTLMEKYVTLLGEVRKTLDTGEPK